MIVQTHECIVIIIKDAEYMSSNSKSQKSSCSIALSKMLSPKGKDSSEINHIMLRVITYIFKIKKNTSCIFILTGYTSPFLKIIVW